MTRLRALLALAASLALVLIGAQRAEARIVEPTDLTVPADREKTANDRLPVAGRFTVNGGRRYVDVTLQRDEPGAPVVRHRVTAFEGSDFGFEGSERYAFNGRYRVRAVFVNEDDRSTAIGGCGSQPCTRTIEREVFLAAPPAKPTGLGATFDKAKRRVVVTWDPAPEVDLKGWHVTRRFGETVGEPQTVIASSKPTFVDEAIPKEGGQLEYTVTPLRSSGVDNTLIAGEPASTAVKADPLPPDAPPPPPGATTTTLSPFGPVVTAPPANPATTRPKTRASGSVGDFAEGLQGAGGRAGGPRRTLEDGSFEDTLPYDEEEDEGDLGASEGEASQVFAESPEDDRRPFVFYGAAAALAAVVGLHVLYLLKQVRLADVPLEAIPADELLPPEPLAAPTVDPPPEPAEPGAGEAPKPRRVPRRVR